MPLNSWESDKYRHEQEVRRYQSERERLETERVFNALVKRYYEQDASTEHELLEEDPTADHDRGGDGERQERAGD